MIPNDIILRADEYRRLPTVLFRKKFRIRYSGNKLSGWTPNQKLRLTIKNRMLRFTRRAVKYGFHMQIALW